MCALPCYPCFPLAGVCHLPTFLFCCRSHLPPYLPLFAASFKILTLTPAGPTAMTGNPSSPSGGEDGDQCGAFHFLVLPSLSTSTSGGDARDGANQERGANPGGHSRGEGGPNLLWSTQWVKFCRTRTSWVLLLRLNNFSPRHPCGRTPLVVSARTTRLREVSANTKLQQAAAQLCTLRHDDIRQNVNRGWVISQESFGNNVVWERRQNRVGPGPFRGSGYLCRPPVRIVILRLAIEKYVFKKKKNTH